VNIQHTENPIDRLDECRFKADILRLAIAGLERGDLAHPDDALASLGWLVGSGKGADKQSQSGEEIGGSIGLWNLGHKCPTHSKSTNVAPTLNQNSIVNDSAIRRRPVFRMQFVGNPALNIA